MEVCWIGEIVCWLYYMERGEWKLDNWVKYNNNVNINNSINSFDIVWFINEGYIEIYCIL